MQSVMAGLTRSVVGMGTAAAGWLPPLAGALFQEVIDVAVVLNALRCLGHVTGQGRSLPLPGYETGRRTSIPRTSPAAR